MRTRHLIIVCCLPESGTPELPIKLVPRALAEAPESFQAALTAGSESAAENVSLQMAGIVRGQRIGVVWSGEKKQMFLLDL